MKNRAPAHSASRETSITSLSTLCSFSRTFSSSHLTSISSCFGIGTATLGQVCQNPKIKHITFIKYKLFRSKHSVNKFIWMQRLVVDESMYYYWKPLFRVAVVFYSVGTVLDFGIRLGIIPDQVSPFQNCSKI